VRYVFLGAPGAGKGTQAQRFSLKYQIPHIATGDLLRAAIQEETPLGVSAKSYIEAGQLVPDQLIIDLMKARLLGEDTQRGYILDGFPRTLAQGEALGALLRECGQDIRRVLYFRVDEGLLLDRIVGRRTCPSCQSVYHLVYNAPKQEGLCDCGAKLVHRKDDRAETVRARLAAYRSETLPLVAFYKKRGVLVEVEAGVGLKAVTESVEAVFMACAA